jgi:hypothetical protein
LVAACVLGLGAGPRPTALGIFAQDVGQPARHLLNVPAGVEESFVLAYTHSVNRFPVREALSIERSGGGDARLVVTGQAVRGDGAGIGEVPGETRWSAAPGGWQRLDGLHRVLDEPLAVRVGWVADHRLVYGGRAVALGELAPGGSRLVIRPVTVSPLRWLHSEWTWHQQRTEATGDGA